MMTARDFARSNCEFTTQAVQSTVRVVAHLLAAARRMSATPCSSLEASSKCCGVSRGAMLIR